MRSQMLLISCAAVRVPAIATMSHSASKQGEALETQSGSAAPSRFHKHTAAPGKPQKNVLPNQRRVSKSSLQVTAHV